MKTKLIAVILFALTGTAVMSYPELANSFRNPYHPPSQPPAVTVDAPRVEVVFVLDTTGSMGGLIQTAKDKIWSIATTMASAQPAPEIRMGLVAYRDRGDDYVTRVTDLSDDLDSVYATLMDYHAQGGGDTPESVNAALGAALDNMTWSQDPDTYRVVFLVGDAPPHMDYQDEEQYPQILARAQRLGVVVNTIRCGDSAQTQQSWQQIASLAQGDYFTVAQAGGGVAIATPYDAELASLSAALDQTRLFFGDGAAREKAASKLAATDKLHAEATDASRARRAAFNASPSGEANLFGDLDLVSALESGRVKLEDVEAEALPEVLQPLAPEARQEYVASQADERAKLQKQILEISSARDEYLTEQAGSREDLSDSLDYQLFESVRAQAAEKGLSYDAASPKL
jgi:Mg-chelatase subunit ChlD